MVPDINQPLTQRTDFTQVKELFETFPELDGLVIRFGETYLFDTPYHAGGNPVRSGGKEGIDGHVQLINLLKSEVCEKYNKKLFTVLGISVFSIQMQMCINKLRIR